jgi:fatty acid desaturase
LTLSDSLLLQIINAVVFGFFSVQLGLIGHDLSHGGVFTSKKLNRWLAILVWSLGCGLSEGRWFYKHNAHHENPNHIGHDPDLEIPFVFSHEQALERPDFYKKWVFPYQHITFWFGLWFVYPYNILNSMRFLFSNHSLRSIIEILLMAIHFILLFGATLFFLPFTTAIIFNLIIFLVMGIYMGLIFAPNHKGEDMLEAEATYNWVHQITLTRNIKPGIFVSYFLGGLEHQIEHHLFPTMPRFRYQEARKIVRAFCHQQNIPYHETTWLESMRQIHASLREESRAWRT